MRLTSSDDSHWPSSCHWAHARTCTHTHTRTAAECLFTSASIRIAGLCVGILQNLQPTGRKRLGSRMFEGDSWDFTAEAGRSRLAVGSALMKERLMKEPSESCWLKKPPAAHAGREAEERRRRPVITEQRVRSRTSPAFHSTSGLTWIIVSNTVYALFKSVGCFFAWVINESEHKNFYFCKLKLILLLSTASMESSARLFDSFQRQ